MRQQSFDASKCGHISDYDLDGIRRRVAGEFNQTLARLQLDQSLSGQLENIYIPLAAILAKAARNFHGPMVVGINGAQGSGKSTLCELLAIILKEGFDLAVTGFSIDDLYSTRAERSRMATDIHPLLQTRGVPGTHDLELGNQLLDTLLSQEPGKSVLIPSFDKSIDDRRPVEQWRTAKTPFDMILFEGWCVGARPQDEKALLEPVNELEDSEDATGGWRRYVNDRLATDYAAFFNRMDLLIMLQIPGFDYVYKWRSLQESKLAASSAVKTRVMNDNELRRFIMHYERLTRHMLDEMPERADILLHIGENHQITNIHSKLLTGQSS